MADDSHVASEVRVLTGSADPELVWTNELGGTAWRAGDVFVKWNPLTSGIDLEREAKRLRWLEGRHPAPVVVDFGANADAEWLITKTLAGESAVAPRWKAQPDQAVEAIAAGLRALHSLDATSFPTEWSRESWVTRDLPAPGARPSLIDAVLVHGDACSPNTLMSEGGAWVANVDFVDLAVGDRWADLAVASMALKWNYGPNLEDHFFDAYGVEPDTERIEYYRALWHAES